MMKNSKGVEFTPILCVDFDGVINSYKSGGLARGGRSDYIPDPPVPGALRWLNEAMKDWDVQIYSGRSRDAAGIELDFGRFRRRRRGHSPCAARYGPEFR